MTRCKPELFLAISLGMIYPAGLVGQTVGEAPASVVTQTLHYQMRGEVRILLFWLGRDNVGGGSISLSRGVTPGGDYHWRQIEALFGSNPERIPGDVNRWGYGRERMFWKDGDTTDPASADWTLFEGFISHSDEETISDVVKQRAPPGDSRFYWYDATYNNIGRESSTAEFRFFADTKPFDHRRPQQLLAGYRARLASVPPDIKEELSNDPPVYSEPYGFLHGMHYLVHQLTTSLKDGELDLQRLRPAITYVFNAEPHRLEVRDLQLPSEQWKPLAKHSEDLREKVGEVARADLHNTNLVKKLRRAFTLYFPVRGPYQSVPVRIVYAPRWWLRIQLDLDFDRSSTTPASTESTTRR